MRTFVQTMSRRAGKIFVSRSFASCSTSLGPYVLNSSPIFFCPVLPQSRQVLEPYVHLHCLKEKDRENKWGWSFSANDSIIKLPRKNSLNYRVITHACQSQQGICLLFLLTNIKIRNCKHINKTSILHFDAGNHILQNYFCQAFISYQLQSEVYFAPGSNILQNKEQIGSV